MCGQKTWQKKKYGVLATAPYDLAEYGSWISQMPIVDQTSYRILHAATIVADLFVYGANVLNVFFKHHPQNRVSISARTEHSTTGGLKSIDNVQPIQWQYIMDE